jgi:YD repeat-containing protein
LIAYDAAERLSSVTDREGARSTYTYDALGRIKKATATGKSSTGAATTISGLTFAYDKNSNPTSITNQSAQKSTLTYDPLDRLTKEVLPGLTLAYTYDKAGNRKSLARTTSSGTTTTGYTYDVAEQMTKAGATSYSYDRNGNMVSATSGTTTTSYSYDFEDQLLRAGSTTFMRDAFGRAVSSTVGTMRTDYIFDGQEAIQQKTGTAATIYYARGLGGSS